MTLSYETFTELVRCCFLGGSQTLGAGRFTLEPTVIRTGDFFGPGPKFGPKSEMNRLFSELSLDSNNEVRSELSSGSGHWLGRGISEKKIKLCSNGSDVLLIPFLGEPAVGIETSNASCDTYVCIAFFDNYRAGYYYMERILKLPKSKHGPGNEFKWNKLNTNHRESVLEHLEELLKMSCSDVIMFKTNALIRNDEKLLDVFKKLINGLFSNYDHKKDVRLLFKQRLFALTNRIPIHCDYDFKPLYPSAIAKLLIQILSGTDNFDLVHMQKHSHESEPIQLADILCGALKERIIGKNYAPLASWEFDNKLKTKRVKKTAKCYVWRFA